MLFLSMKWVVHNVEIPILWILDIVSLFFQVLSRLTSSHHVVFLCEGGGACAAFQQPRDKPRSQVCDTDAGQKHMWVKHKHTQWCFSFILYLNFSVYTALSLFSEGTFLFMWTHGFQTCLCSLWRWLNFGVRVIQSFVNSKVKRHQPVLNLTFCSICRPAHNLLPQVCQMIIIFPQDLYSHYSHNSYYPPFPLSLAHVLLRKKMKEHIKKRIR